LLLEDVDCVAGSRELEPATPSAQARAPPGLSLADLLHVLDGVTEVDAKPFIVVMTTNYRDRLDPAVLRKGRVDVDVPIGYVCTEQSMQLLRRFYPDVSDEQARVFAATVPDRTTPADLEAMFIVTKEQLDVALAYYGRV
jgi:chaperone BCS1